MVDVVALEAVVAVAVAVAVVVVVVVVVIIAGSGGGGGGGGGSSCRRAGGGDGGGDLAGSGGGRGEVSGSRGGVLLNMSSSTTEALPAERASLTLPRRRSAAHEGKEGHFARRRDGEGSACVRR